jgi:eukaryotic-like serine/threonine-protein kinase
MDQGLWEKVRTVFDSALSLPAEQHAEFLERSCGGDTELRDEVEKLLQHLEQADGFLSSDGAQILLQPEDVISERYRVLAHIGSGGMGDVYEVEDQHLQEIVALKTFRVDAFGSHGTLEHLKREIRHARRVVHRNVCRHFDIGYDANNSRATAYLTMERIHGEPLHSYLTRRDGLEAEEALRFAEQLCSALGAAHQEKIIHGDLKTGNMVYAEAERRLVILDFGLSRFQANEDAHTGTMSRRVAGTPAYLAPERYEGSAASYAGDMYSLGVILHELITNQLPPVERDEQGRRQVAASVPPQWAAAIRACLSLNPPERPATPALVFEMLAAGAARSFWPRTRVALIAVAGVAVVLFGTGALLVHHGGFPRRALSKAAVSVPAAVGTARVTSNGRPGPQDLFHTGMLYLDRDTSLSLDRAIVAFQQGLALEPRNAAANAELARALLSKYQMTKQPDLLQQAGARLAIAEQVAPGSPEVLLAKASTQRNRGQLGEAVSTLKKSLALNRSDGEAWRQLALTYSQAGNVLEAQTTFEEGLKQNSSDWSLYADFGWFYYTHGQYDRAEAELQAARELAPDEPLTLSNLGGVYLATGRLREAQQMLSEALNLEPSADVATNLGTVYFNLGQFREAARSYREACTLRPKDDILWANLGDALLEEGKIAEAKTAYAQAAVLAQASLQHSPANVPLLSVLALYFAKAGHLQEARKNLDRVLHLAPHDLRVLLQAAITEELMGQRDAALQDLEQALAAGATVQEIEGTFELKRLRADPAYARISQAWSSGKSPHAKS